MKDEDLKIYFAAPLHSPQKQSLEHYKKLISVLSAFGQVINPKIVDQDERSYPSERVHDYDLRLVRDSDVLVAEVSHPSHGVGYEIRYALEQNKKVACLYQGNGAVEDNLSKMIAGAPSTKILQYREPEDLQSSLGNFLGNKV